MDLPEYCFCGCGERRGKLNAENMEGVSVAISMGRWLNFFTIMKSAAPEADFSEAERFVEDGRTVYELLLGEVHDDIRRDRSERKEARRWLKFDQKSRKKIGKGFGEDDPNPFEASPFPNVVQIRAFALEGTLLPIDDLPDEGDAS